MSPVETRVMAYHPARHPEGEDDVTNPAPTAHPAAGNFQEEATRVLAPLQGELRAFIQQTVPEVRSAAELRRALGIDYNLSWRIMRALDAPTPLEAGPFVPAYTSVRNMIRAAERKGLGPGPAGFERASRRFHEFIESHAGDRGTFDAVVSSLTGADADRLDAELKRNAFRTNSQIYGKSIDVKLSCMIVRPSGEPGFIDAAKLFRIEGLRRTRAHASLLFWKGGIADRPTKHAGVVTEPIDEEAFRLYGVPVLGRFSDGSPPLREVRGADGYNAVHLTTPDLGLQSTVSCTLAEVHAGATVRSMAGPEALIGQRCAVFSPCRIMYVDTLVHEEIFSDAMPDFVVVADHAPPKKWVPTDAADALPIQEEVTCLGHAPHALHAVDLPDYRAMIEHVFETLGWGELERYRLFRCRAEHPVLKSLFIMQFDVSPWAGATGIAS